MISLGPYSPLSDWNRPVPHCVDSHPTGSGFFDRGMGAHATMGSMHPPHPQSPQGPPVIGRGMQYLPAMPFPDGSPRHFADSWRPQVGDTRTPLLRQKPPVKRTRECANACALCGVPDRFHPRSGHTKEGFCPVLGMHSFNRNRHREGAPCSRRGCEGVIAGGEEVAYGQRYHCTVCTNKWFRPCVTATAALRAAMRSPSVTSGANAKKELAAAWRPAAMTLKTNGQHGGTPLVKEAQTENGPVKKPTSVAAIAGDASLADAAAAARRIMAPPPTSVSDESARMHHKLTAACILVRMSGMGRE